jgi:predicted CopG family antitoxin
LSESNYEKLIKARNKISSDFINQLNSKKKELIDKIKLHISIENLEQQSDGKDLDQFYS